MGPAIFGALMSSTHFQIAGESLPQRKATGDQSGSLTPSRNRQPPLSCLFLLWSH